MWLDFFLLSQDLFYFTIGKISFYFFIGRVGGEVNSTISGGGELYINARYNIFLIFLAKSNEKNISSVLGIVRQKWPFLRPWGGEGGTTFRFVSVRQNMSKYFFAHVPKKQIYILLRHARVERSQERVPKPQKTRLVLF